MFALTNEVRRYAWGSRTAMAEFLGQPSPSAEPEAELWIGAYPGEPSHVPDGRSLLQAIEDNPVAMLGTAVAQFGTGLPFMMKVLAIGAPLSLQAHPDASQAAVGFAAEEAAGIPVGDPIRNYRDERHKPEMLCALTRVEAFCGFRPVEDTVALLHELDIPELAGLRESLAGPGLRDSISWVFDVADSEVAKTVSALAKSAAQVTAGRHVDALQWISRLADDFPADRGVILALLCEFVRLEAGQALVIPAGCLHAYLSGLGVEIMTVSDNVLRGGLTAKHVDGVDLQRVLTLSGEGARVLQGEVGAHGRTRFPSDIEEFDVHRHEITGRVVLEGNRPRLVLAVDGCARLQTEDGTELELPCGQAAFIAASDGDTVISGPAVVFEATTTSV